MGLELPILQVVGYQNSGKTSVMELLVAHFSKQGLKVATLKHHGHGGKPAYSHEHKDSDRHRKAGAMASGVAGNGSFLMQLETETSLELESLLDVYAALSVEKLLIEGYKNASYQKIVCVRNRNDLDLLTTCCNIVAVVSLEKLAFLHTFQYPYFVMKNDQADFLQFVNDLLT